jgi:hypothetical protein
MQGRKWIIMVNIPLIDEDDVGTTSDLINAINYSLNVAQSEINRELLRIEDEATSDNKSNG